MGQSNVYIRKGNLIQLDQKRILILKHQVGERERHKSPRKLLSPNPLEFTCMHEISSFGKQCHLSTGITETRHWRFSEMG